jgi:hypothetical protein
VTGARSSVKFQIGQEEPYTALVIESNALTILGEAYKTQERKRTRIGVGRGRIRAGVAEGGLRSDFTVDTPVATLSKRGTWNFGIYFEPGTDRFEVFLLDRGLAEVLNELTQERRSVQPGQLMTQAMRRWYEQSQIVRNVPTADLFGQDSELLAFDTAKNDGLGVLEPGGGRSVAASFANSQAAAATRPNFPRVSPPDLTPPRGIPVRPEGFFGTGRGGVLATQKRR